MWMGFMHALPLTHLTGPWTFLVFHFTCSVCVVFSVLTVFLEEASTGLGRDTVPGHHPSGTSAFSLTYMEQTWNSWIWRRRSFNQYEAQLRFIKRHLKYIERFWAQRLRVKKKELGKEVKLPRAWACFPPRDSLTFKACGKDKACQSVSMGFSGES